MNADDIRALAIERLARGGNDFGRPWPLLQPRERESLRSWATRAVDALDDLLPVARESRVYPCDCCCEDCETAALNDGATRQYRYVGEWKKEEQ